MKEPRFENQENVEENKQGRGACPPGYQGYYQIMSRQQILTVGKVKDQWNRRKENNTHHLFLLT